MKKTILLLFTIFLVACSSTKNKPKSNNQIGNFTIDKDHVSIITPYIEIKEKSNSSFINHPDKRKALLDFTIKTLQSQYPNANYVEVPFLFKDYRTINSKIEGRAAITGKDVPKELLTDKNKHAIFISINGYFGDLNRGVMMLYIIDNITERWIMIDRTIYNNSPLETKRMKKRILKSLEKLK